MSGAISLDEFERVTALSRAGGTESRQQEGNRQGKRGGSDAGAVDSFRLSPDAEKQVQKLRERDGEVRAHEQAHIAAGGQYVSGGATFSYQAGPDGRQYAVGGSVQIDTSPVPGNPKATEEKARIVRRAALAPANPSSADQNVAAKAAAMESNARSEQAEQAGDAEKDGPAAPDAAGVSNGLERMQRRATNSYERIASPLYGASRQSGAGNGESAANVEPSPPWPGQKRAAAIYASMRQISQTALAPWGTGISLEV